MKQLLAIGKMDEDARACFKYLEQFFGVQMMESPIDSCTGVIEAMKPDLLLVSLEELLVSPTMALNTIQDKNPELNVVTFGKVQDFVRFEKLYVGGPLDNLNIPFEEEAAMYLICTKLKVSQKKIKQEAAKKKTILIVDDDATTLRSLKTMLEEKYNVNLANSGEKTFEMLSNKIPDLILLDYEMPDMDGKEVLEKIRADEKYRGIPVIFVTGISDKEQITPLIALRPSGYILKPITMDIIKSEVAKVIG